MLFRSGVAAVWLTGWARLDPLIALAVAANIVWSGYQLMQRSVHGLLDRALPPEKMQALAGALERYRTRGIDFLALRVLTQNSFRLGSTVLADGPSRHRNPNDLLPAGARWRPPPRSGWDRGWTPPSRARGA